MSDKPKRKSRWVKDSGVPRYDERTLSGIVAQYHPQPGWRNGARVSRRK